MRKALIERTRERTEFNDLTITMVCDLDDQLVRYIGKNLAKLDDVQVTEVMAFVRNLRHLKALLLTHN